MGYPNKIFSERRFRIIHFKKLLFLVFYFLVTGNTFSQEDNGGNSKCLLVKINGIRKCMDTSIIYFPQYHMLFGLTALTITIRDASMYGGKEMV